MAVDQCSTKNKVFLSQSPVNNQTGRLMKHGIDYFGYIYQWTNVSNGKKYIGSHFGSVEDRYVGAGIDFYRAYKKNPELFSMIVLEFVRVNDKKLVLTTEEKWLDQIPDIKSDPNYYNLNNEAAGGFGYITRHHIEKRAATLKEKHVKFGLSESELNSYAEKIKSRLTRINNTGFTVKEIEQHAKYSCEVQVTTPTGEIKKYVSYSKLVLILGLMSNMLHQSVPKDLISKGTL